MLHSQGILNLLNYAVTASCCPERRLGQYRATGANSDDTENCQRTSQHAIQSITRSEPFVSSNDVLRRLSAS